MADRSVQGYEYIIVGAGAIGASTASHLSHQSKSILVLDHQLSGAASRDLNKIVRFDYTDPFYMNLAHEAWTEWTSNHLFKDHFHQTGRVVAYDDENQLSSIKANHEQNGLSILEGLSPAAAARKLGGIIKCPDRRGLNITYNPLDAWVDFPQCVARMLDAAVSRGAFFKPDRVEELSFDASGRCTGVRTTDEAIPCSGKVVVAVGAWTEKFLATHSAHFSIERHNLAKAAPSRCPVATGVCVIHFALDGEVLEKFRSIPIFSYPGHGKSPPSVLLSFTVLTVPPWDRRDTASNREWNH